MLKTAILRFLNCTEVLLFIGLNRYSDYYPFGMIVPSRHGSAESYRYGFQGQEMDNEIKGEGNSLNYTFRMHDPRVGRFFAVDPLIKEYPHYTPYSFSGNKVIAFAEFEGLEDVWVADGSKIVKKVGPYVGAYTSYEAANNRYLEFTARKPKMARPLAEIRSDNLEDQMNKYRGVNPGLAVSRGVIDGFGQAPGVILPEMAFAKAAKLYESYKIAKRSKMALQAVKAVSKTENAVYQGAEFIDDGYRMIDAPLLEKAPKISRLKDIEIIVDENLSPQIDMKLKEAGYTIKRFDKGVLDDEIIAYAQKNKSVVLTNNIKDFKGKGINTISVSEKLKTRANIGKVVEGVKNANEKYSKGNLPSNIPLTSGN